MPPKQSSGSTSSCRGQLLAEVWSGFEFKFESELQSFRSRSNLSLVFLCVCLCLLVIWVRIVRALENALRMLPGTPPGNALRGTLGTPPRDHPGARRKEPEKDHLDSKSIMAIAWGIARGNEGLGTSTSIAQSPSHSLSHPLKGMASQQLQLAQPQCELP